MTKITARIEKEKGGLWIFVTFRNDVNDPENWAVAITEEELPAIREAIDSYLKEKKE